MKTTMHIAVILLLAIGALGCEKFDSPPIVTVRSIEDGILPDAGAPLVLQFHEPVNPDSLKVRVVFVSTTAEGEQLASAEVFFDSAFPSQGTASFNADRTRYTIDIDRTLPVGPRLAFAIEPGLADDDGNAWTAPQLIEFAFGFHCDPTEVVPTTFASAAHFMLADVEEPLSVQLQLLADIVVDADSGTYIAQVTNADRDASIDCNQFGLACAPEEVCRTLPEPNCVLPSERALSADEYPDYIHNNSAEDGYSFTIAGCVRDQADGSWAFTNVPVDVQVPQPEVRVVDIAFHASFAADEMGVVRGAGSFTALDILLGALLTSSGAGAGSVKTRTIPPEEIKPGLPLAPDEAPPPSE